MSENKDKISIQELDTLISQAEKKRQDPLDKKTEKKSEKGGPLGLAFRVSVEIVSAVAIGTLIGLLIDNWWGTRPWMMLLFVVLGCAAGMLNVYRIASGFGYAVGYRQRRKKDEPKQ
ncbi:MAG: phosphoribosylaminoimidazolecarboxamide formyltransferase [Magnetovibrio sp.]|nr:phosphoribosylaminoimidazolecarboxamide formyltransferase [Magnetovibrio sp.]|tara:strand:+ start:895 stop:1245 length:351 start_codon:yes stop_codon:yes gene_type:complete